MTSIVFGYYITACILVLADLSLIYISWKVSLRLVKYARPTFCFLTGFNTLALLATLMLIVGYVIGRIFNPMMLATVFDLYNIETTQQLSNSI